MEKKISPYILILISFIFIIVIGASLLTLSISLKSGVKISFFEALFTATSAVTVTGLTILDVSKTFNRFGNIIILILIQLGGLGILTFSSLIVLIVSKKIGYYTKKIVKEDLNFEDKFDIYLYMKKVAMVVFGIELLGAIFLLSDFLKEYSIGEAIFYSIFHSISAFCNAGFSLFSNNFEGFVDNVYVNIIIAFLIFTGGVGFAAIIDIYEYIQGRGKRLTINTKFSLYITVSLLFIGAILFFTFEYTNSGSIGEMSFLKKILASFFQSVSLRTAGFNTVNLNNLRIPTVLVSCILMFIGASSGSTGGGIKTNTVGIIFLGIKASIKNREEIVFSRRRISFKAFNKAVALLFIALSYLFVIFLLMSIFESDKDLVKVLFELISAMGTVGLSMGITSSLTIYSKMLIIITMFLGRVGLLTVVLALSRSGEKGKYIYPEGNILIG
ncbi:TrkH family potassium uptake protein [Streptobacillus moniliformis]|uniref:Potassium uptake protein, TrkH family n=3 Tax=Streptobacillus moniliformis TaxID=34105 RepID=D1AYP3_STRM9|nr:TrkH family potassium uptake protein [Streptobacillus moniliformis]ACZ01419.1 potassium uptake protein, TrkH family [Streptobacillus moniliformis DSM 12112]AVL43570.1 potassium transporter KtrB [Streptobacillus moniliformis]SQA13421.1 Ktr system potassium uptake protein B [Streptobacillus moniliformis]